MRGPLVVLCFVTFSLAWLTFFGAGVARTEWNATILLLGATALFYWSFRTGQTPPASQAWHVIALWAVPTYAVFQLLPIPPALLDVLSPSRAHMTATVNQVLSGFTYSPVAITPAAALAGLFGLLGYITVFSLIRDISWRCVEVRAWLVPAPIIAIAGIECCLGMAQWLSGGTPRGTLASSEFLAALLEIALPFAIVFGFISFRRYQLQTSPSAWPVVQASLAWLMAVLMLTLLLLSPSPTSRAVVVASLYVLLAFALVPRLRTVKLRRYGSGAAAGLALVLILTAVPVTSVPEWLADLGATRNASANSRLTIWNNSANVVDEFRWFGTGMGGFQSIYPKYQSSSDLSPVQTAHSDFLALLISFGIVGTIIFLVAIAGIVRPAIMGAIFLQNEPRRLLAASILASIVAVLTRSCLQSSLSAPAVAVAAAWLAGLSQSSGLE